MANYPVMFVVANILTGARVSFRTEHLARDYIRRRRMARVNDPYAIVRSQITAILEG